MNHFSSLDLHFCNWTLEILKYLSFLLFSPPTFLEQEVFLVLKNILLYLGWYINNNTIMTMVISFSLSIQIGDNCYCVLLITNIFLTWNCLHYLISIMKASELRTKRFQQLYWDVLLSFIWLPLLYSQSNFIFLYHSKVTFLIFFLLKQNTKHRRKALFASCLQRFQSMIGWLWVVWHGRQASLMGWAEGSKAAGQGPSQCPSAPLVLYPGYQDYGRAKAISGLISWSHHP